MIRHVVVLYNSEIEAMMPWRGWQREDVMDVIFSHTEDYEDSPDKAICEAAFHTFQEVGRFGIRLRSMSVGDVVIVDEKAYKCAGIGFEEIELADVQMRTVMEIISRRVQ